MRPRLCRTLEPKRAELYGVRAQPLFEALHRGSSVVSACSSTIATRVRACTPIAHMSSRVDVLDAAIQR